LADRVTIRRSAVVVAFAAAPAILAGLWFVDALVDETSPADTPGPPAAAAPSEHPEFISLPPPSAVAQALRDRSAVMRMGFELQELPKRSAQEIPEPGEQRLRWLEALADGRSDALVDPIAGEQAQIEELLAVHRADLLSRSAGLRRLSPSTAQQSEQGSGYAIRRYACDDGGVISHETLHASGRVMRAPITSSSPD
jgi:hypothetical protein